MFLEHRHALALTCGMAPISTRLLGILESLPGSSIITSVKVLTLLRIAIFSWRSALILPKTAHHSLVTDVSLIPDSIIDDMSRKLDLILDKVSYSKDSSKFIFASIIKDSLSLRKP